jgi:hypothetical protein
MARKSSLAFLGHARQSGFCSEPTIEANFADESDNIDRWIGWFGGLRLLDWVSTDEPVHEKRH